MYPLKFALFLSKTQLFTFFHGLPFPIAPYVVRVQTYVGPQRCPFLARAAATLQLHSHGKNKFRTHLKKKV